MLLSGLKFDFPGLSKFLDPDVQGSKNFLDRPQKSKDEKYRGQKSNLRHLANLAIAHTTEVSWTITKNVVTSITVRDN